MTIWHVLLVGLFGLTLGGFNCYVLRRLYMQREQIERLEAALLWTHTTDCHITMRAYRPHRILEILGFNSAHGENLLTRYLRDSVNNPN